MTLVDAGSHGSSHSRSQLLSALTNNPFHFWKFQIPSALTYNLRAESNANWHYETTSQPLLNGRSIDQPRGKVRGAKESYSSSSLYPLFANSNNNNENEIDNSAWAEAPT